MSEDIVADALVESEPPSLSVEQTVSVAPLDSADDTLLGGDDADRKDQAETSTS